MQDPPNGGRHRRQHDAELPPDLVIEQHGSQASHRRPQCVDGAEPRSIVGVQLEPGVCIRALEVRNDRGRKDHGVAEVEVPQHG